MKLTLEHVNISHGRRRTVHDASLSVGPGEFVGLLGPNGSGKSTLLKSIYRVMKPDSGRILLNGQDLSSVSPAIAARQLGVVGQFNNVGFDFTVLEMVLMGRSPHKSLLSRDNEQDYTIAISALDKVGMLPAQHRSFSALSGGEKQRVILARALAQEPQLLILDEPTNHLDIKYQLQILAIVKGLGIGVLAALHDLNLAALYCTRLYILKDGMIAAAGAPGEILTPSLIKRVYDIDCDVSVCPATGQVTVSYQPLRRWA